MRVYAAALLLASASPAFADDSITTAWFEKPQAEVENIVALICANRGAMIVEQDDNHVLCQKEVSGIKGAIAQELIGNSYSTTPQLMVRFALIKDHDSTRVQASQWIETQMAFGQIRRAPLTGRKQSESLIDLMIAAGGHNAPPDVISDTPAPDSSAALSGGPTK